VVNFLEMCLWIFFAACLVLMLSAIIISASFEIMDIVRRYRYSQKFPETRFDSDKKLWVFVNSDEK